MTVETAPETDARYAAEARERIYTFLADLFLGPPTGPQIDKLRRLAESAFQFGLLGMESEANLPCALEKLGESDEEELRQEYNRLFVVPGGEYATPYESVFRDTHEVDGKKVTGLLMGPSAQDVKRWYHQAGLELAKDCQELPDHIGLEFGFMAHLYGKECEAWTAGDRDRISKIHDTQRGFLAKHLGVWIDEFSATIEEKAISPFYVALTKFAASVIHLDIERKWDAPLSADEGEQDIPK